VGAFLENVPLEEEGNFPLGLLLNANAAAAVADAAAAAADAAAAAAVLTAMLYIFFSASRDTLTEALNNSARRER